MGLIIFRAAFSETAHVLLAVFRCLQASRVGPYVSFVFGDACCDAASAAARVVNQHLADVVRRAADKHNLNGLSPTRPGTAFVWGCAAGTLPVRRVSLRLKRQSLASSISGACVAGDCDNLPCRPVTCLPRGDTASKPAANRRLLDQQIYLPRDCDLERSI